MSKLIADLLEFSRVSHQPLSVNQVSLDQVIASVCKDLEPETKHRTIHWQIASIPEVREDASLLRQVFFNLLSNAVKYTRDRNPAVIEIFTQTSTDPEVVVTVRENGVGFDMQYAAKLFGMFQRLHSSEDFSGNGVGLTNVRRIMSLCQLRSLAEVDSLSWSAAEAQRPSSSRRDVLFRHLKSAMPLGLTFTLP